MERTMKPKFLALVSTLVNLGLAVLKLLNGIFFHSIALMAEALHSGLDIVSSFIAFLGIKTAEKPPDPKHPYGYERYESLAALFVVFLLFISAGWILYEGVKNIITRETLAQFSFWAIILMAGSVVINEVMARLKFSLGNKFSSLALVADAEHSRADVISSLAVLFGLVLVRFYPIADSFLAIFVSLYIFYEVYYLSRESMDSLVDTANPELEEKIKNFLTKDNISFSEIKTRKIGNSNFAEISLSFDPRAKIDEATSLTKSLEDKLINSISELKQVSILVKSHDFSERVIRPRFGGHFRYRYRFEKIGPKKQGKRIIIPLENNEIAPEFGAKNCLILDVDEKNNVLQKEKIKNPYYQPGGAGGGARLIKSLEGDKVITKHIGLRAKQNLEAMGVEIEIIDPSKKLKDLSLTFFSKGEGP